MELNSFYRFFTIAVLSGCLTFAAYKGVTWLDYTNNKTEPRICSDYKGIGAIFYKFKKLNIVYTDFPTDYIVSREDYPDFLKFEPLTQKIVETIKKNFQGCMKDKKGNFKPIEAFLYRKATPTQMKSVHNPDNLTVSILFRHTLGFDRETQAVFFGGGFSYYFYRPEVKYANARLLAPANSAAISYIGVPIESIAEIENRLNQVIENMRTARSNPDRPRAWE